MVGEDISIADLKGYLLIFIKILGDGVEIEFRPSFFHLWSRG